MEAALDHDFSHVRIHQGPAAERAAASVAAHAFTIGSHVYFGARNMVANGPDPDRLLAHELTHVVQHDEGRILGHRGLAPPHAPIEREAREAEGRGASGMHRGPSLRSHRAPTSAGPLLRYEWSDEELERLAAQLTALHIEGPDDGRPLVDRHRPIVCQDLAPLSASAPVGMEPAEVHAALDQLSVQPSGVRRGWGLVPQDDLGWRRSPADTHRSYWTPLHYGRRLLELARASGAADYEEFRSRTRVVAELAGAEMHIHPRAIYFVAAAQHGMDVAAGETSGHYLAPPSLQARVRALRRGMGALARPVGPRQRFEPRRARYDELVAEARLLVARAHAFEAADTAAARAQRGAEEPERPLVSWLLAHEAELLPSAPPADEAELRLRAAAHAALLAEAPGRVHGMGAMDTHGTAHAMGLAIDFGTAGGRVVNRGFSGHEDFIYFLMEHYRIRDGADRVVVWRPPRPHAIHEFPPPQRHLLSDLVQMYGARAYETIMGRPLPRDAAPDAMPLHPPPDLAQPQAPAAAPPVVEAGERGGAPPPPRAPRELRGAYRTDLVGATRRILNALKATLRRLTRPGAALRGGDPALVERVRDAAGRLDTAIRADVRLMQTMSPRTIAERLRWYEEQLAVIQRDMDAIYSALGEQRVADVRSAQRALEEQEPSEVERPAVAGRSPRRRQRSPAERALDRARAALERVESDARDAAAMEDPIRGAPARQLDPQVQAQWESDQLSALRRAMQNSAFVRWLRAAVDYGIYDQTTIYEIGVEGVRSSPSHTDAGTGVSYLYGGHHWDIAPLSIIDPQTGDAEYRAALQRDMSHRTAEALRVIVGIIQEWPGGAAAMASDGILRDELARRGVPVLSEEP